MKKPSHIESQLKEGGLRVTAQRKAVLSVLVRRERPMSALELAGALAETADTATVYRTLHALEASGLVRRVDLRQNGAAFEYEDPTHHHHHVVCTLCGRLESIAACDFDGLRKDALRSTGFSRITSHAIELFGICAKCGKGAS